MSNDELGWWIFGAATGACVVAAIIVTQIYPLEWFRERLLSSDRWKAAWGMMPFAFPIYLIAGLMFSILRK